METSFRLGTPISQAADGSRATYPPVSNVGKEGDTEAQLLNKLLAAVVAQGAPGTTPTVNATAAPVRATTNGVTVSNCSLAILTNVGAANATVAGVTLAPGERMEFAAPLGYKIADFTVDANGTTVLISKTTI